MKMLKTTLSIILLVVIFSCQNRSYLVRPDAFYNMPTKYMNVTSNGYDQFTVYGTGFKKDECIEDAKLQLLKDVLLNGISNGQILRPLISGAEERNNFERSEIAILQSLASIPNIFSVRKDVVNKIAQSKSRDLPYKMSFVIGLNRGILQSEVINIKNKLR